MLAGQWHRFTLAFAAVVLVLWSADAHARGIYIDAGPQTASLRDHLLREVPLSVTTSSVGADIRVVWRQPLKRLQVFVQETEVLRRRLNTNDNEQAMRLAALLVERSTSVAGQLASKSPTIAADAQPTATASEMRLAVGLRTDIWTTPYSPALAPTVAAGLRWGRFDLALEVGWSGALCCRHRSQGLDATAVEWQFGLFGGLDLVRTHRLRLGTEVGIGLTHVTLRVQSRAFADRAPVESFRGLEGAIRGALRIDAVLGDRLTARIALGAVTRIRPLQVQLPANYRGEVRTGLILPTAQFQLLTRL